MRGVERQEQIKSFIHASQKVTVAELSERWEVTEETVRRDLDKLAEQGFVTRIHGGAIWNVTVSRSGTHFLERQNRQDQAKRIIAQNVQGLIRGCTAIAADASTTVLEALRVVGNEPHLKVVTNATEPLAPSEGMSFQLISTGGIFNRNALAFQGETAAQTILRHHFDLAIISCAGLNLVEGVTDSNEAEVAIKRAMVEQADRVSVLADHTKFGRVAFLKLMDLTHISHLVTDERPSQEWVDRCEELGVDLIF
ncbi:DeoR/GlpR family DNA-binding transcription regulator [Olsenella uli]|uniref:DeoR/GlpR family DNA-binding transcription regulator n=1 Tax=Olsenella uli TaxID=133926 RepID=UPI0024A911BA|nr:DeoR/GlpR family DNA-binding transcription regulator [Olsenella uli]